MPTSHSRDTLADEEVSGAAVEGDVVDTTACDGVAVAVATMTRSTGATEGATDAEGDMLGVRVPASPPAPARGNVGAGLDVGAEEFVGDSVGSGLHVGAVESEGLVEREGLCDAEGISVFGALGAMDGEVLGERSDEGLVLGCCVGLTGAKVGNSVGRLVTITTGAEGYTDGISVGDSDGTSVGSLVGGLVGKDVVGKAVVGLVVGGRVSDWMSLRIDTSLPVVFSSAKAGTYSASANKSSNVHPADKYKAKAPLTVGAAIDVPVLVAVASSEMCPAATMFLPGAHRLMQAPELLVSARTSPSPIFPTAITPGTRAGERVQESSFWFPAAAIIVIPASRTTCAA